jgi:hypothetical protein
VIPKKTQRWLIRLSLAAGTPILLLVVSELACAVAGVRVPRYVGPQAALQEYWVPCRDPNSTPGFDYAIPRENEFQKLPSPIFVKDKPKNGFRVFVLGESTVAAAPYETGGFVDWLRIRMTAMLPDRFVEVVNCGNGGWFSDWISVLNDECLEHEADLIIWLSGHNEFHPWHLENLREAERNPIKAKLVGFAHSLRSFWALARIWPESSRTTVQSVDRNLTPERRCYGSELGALQEDFRANLTNAIRHAHQRGVPFVLCTLPRNARTFPPRTSPFSEKVGPRSPARARFDRAFRTGNEAVAKGNAAAAIKAFEEARAIDDTPAKLHFSLGRALEIDHRPDEARKEYLLAIEKDGCPSRAQQWTQTLLRELATTERLPMVDLETAFDDRGKNGLAGGELIRDGLHPNFKGHEFIASEILRVLERELAIPLDRSRDVPPETARKMMRLDDYDRERALHVECMANAKIVLETGQESEYATRVIGQCRQQLEISPDDAFVRFHLGLLEALTGDPAAGNVDTERAIRESRRVRYKAVLSARNEPPYARAIQAAHVDLAAAEAGLTPFERDNLKRETRR